MAVEPTPRTVPKGQVLERIRRELDISLSDDRLDRLRKATLIGPTVAIAGTTERGYTIDMANRIMLIASIIKYFGKQRLREAEIAFWLAYCGIRVPAPLVLKHLEASAKCFVSSSRRLLDSRGKGYLASNGNAGALVGPLLKGLAKLFSWGKRADLALGKPVGLLVYITLNGMLSTKAFLGLKRLLLEIGAQIRGEPIADGSAPATVLWEVVTGFMPFIRLDDQNRMIVAAQTFDPADADTLYTAAVAVRHFRETASTIIPFLAHASPETINPKWKFTQQDFDFANRYMAPCMCATLLGMRDDPASAQRTRDLAAGNLTDATSDLLMAKAIGERLGPTLGPDVNYLEKAGEPDIPHGGERRDYTRTLQGAPMRRDVSV